MGTSPSLPAYDPRVIEQFAENLYRKASAFVVGSVAIGAALGAAFGAVPLTSLGDAWPIPSIFGFATLLVGGMFGGLIGFVIGDTRSFGYRLQAQTALCQLETERNTAALARAVAAARMTPQRAAPAPPQAPPAPRHEPVTAQPPSPPASAPPPQPPVQHQAPAAPEPPATPEPPLTPPVTAARVA